MGAEYSLRLKQTWWFSPFFQTVAWRSPSRGLVGRHVPNVLSNSIYYGGPEDSQGPQKLSSYNLAGQLDREFRRGSFQKRSVGRQPLSSTASAPLPLSSLPLL